MAKRKKIIIKNQGELLLKYMKEHNLTKKKFAEISGLTISKLNGFLQNKNVLLDTLFKLSRATEISIGDLVDYKIVDISENNQKRLRILAVSVSASKTLGLSHVANGYSIKFFIVFSAFFSSRETCA